MRFLAAVFVFALVAVSPARAEKRVALVIGNVAYKNAATCKILETMRRMSPPRCSFETIIGLDLDESGMKDNSIAFARGEYRKQTVPIDSFAPNPWGLPTTGSTSSASGSGGRLPPERWISPPASA
jgi:hypothetical protein